MCNVSWTPPLLEEDDYIKKLWIILKIILLTISEEEKVVRNIEGQRFLCVKITQICVICLPTS